MLSSRLVLLAITLAFTSLTSFESQAAGSSYDDLDDLDGKKGGKEKKSRKAVSEEEVREIVKGFYAKSDIGGWAYVGTFNGFVRPGTSLALALGQDFIDKENTSMAWEVAFFQGIHNGTPYEIQADAGCGQGAPCLEGDLRTYTLLGLLEWSTYPTRRFGIGARVGGGVLYSPLLMYREYYETDVLAKEFHGYDGGWHDVPHPVVMGGPTVEYYTKMSHFSVGGDIDAVYGIGWDIGVSFCGFLKYTF